MAKQSAFARVLKTEETALPPPKPVVVSDSAPRQASRIGLKTVIFYDIPEAVRELKRVGVDNDRTIQDLMREAVDDLLVKYGRHAFGKR